VDPHRKEENQKCNRYVRGKLPVKFLHQIQQRLARTGWVSVRS
jgi:hypothetical protein